MLTARRLVGHTAAWRIDLRRLPGNRKIVVLVKGRLDRSVAGSFRVNGYVFFTPPSNSCTASPPLR